MIDSHCHLNDKAFAKDLDEVIDRAFANGVDTLLVIGWDVESSKEAIAIAHKKDGIYAAVGIHPENIEGISLNEIEKIRELAKDEKVIAIGEIGLDHHWVTDPKVWEAQRQFFIAQIKLANELCLPVSIHSREAAAETLGILKEYPIENHGVLHCYSNSPDMIHEFSKLGLYFGFDGPITFKNSHNPRQSVLMCPNDRILTETDCPYLTPSPHRGERNEPSYVAHITETISNVKGKSNSDIEEMVRDNFNRLFHVKHL